MLTHLLRLGHTKLLDLSCPLMLLLLLINIQLAIGCRRVTLIVVDTVWRELSGRGLSKLGRGRLDLGRVAQRVVMSFNSRLLRSVHETSRELLRGRKVLAGKMRMSREAKALKRVVYTRLIKLIL